MKPEDSFIGRWVAFLILPFATALSTLVATKAKAWFGVELDPAEVVAFVLSIASGIAVWLYNRGKYEVAHLTGIDEDTVDGVVQKVIEQKLPAPPTAPAPPGTPGAPSPPVPLAGVGQPGTPLGKPAPGGTSEGQ